MVYLKNCCLSMFTSVYTHSPDPVRDSEEFAPSLLIYITNSPENLETLRGSEKTSDAKEDTRGKDFADVFIGGTKEESEPCPGVEMRQPGVL